MARASFLIVLAFSIPFRAICDLIIAQPVPDPGNSTTTVVEAFPRNNKIIRNDAVLCLPVPLSEDDEKRLQTLQLARRNESRGIDATGSGLGALGLAKRHSFTRAVKQGNAPFLTVDTWFHIVVTVDQARQFSEQTRKDMVARQVCGLPLHISIWTTRAVLGAKYYVKNLTMLDSNRSTHSTPPTEPPTSSSTSSAQHTQCATTGPRTKTQIV